MTILTNRASGPATQEAPANGGASPSDARPSPPWHPAQSFSKWASPDSAFRSCARAGRELESVWTLAIRPEASINARTDRFLFVRFSINRVEYILTPLGRKDESLRCGFAGSRFVRSANREDTKNRLMKK